MKRYITLDNFNRVSIIRYGKIKGEYEIESELGELGQVMQADGTFITPDPIPSEPTIEERLSSIEDTQNLILLKLEGVIV